MGKRQLAVLFLCSLVPWTIGNGIAPLLSVQAAGLGTTLTLLAGACLPVHAAGLLVLCGVDSTLVADCHAKHSAGLRLYLWPFVVP